MKTQSLLFSLPLLVSVLASQAPAAGKYDAFDRPSGTGIAQTLLGGGTKDTDRETDALADSIAAMVTKSVAAVFPELSSKSESTSASGSTESSTPPSTSQPTTPPDSMTTPPDATTPEEVLSVMPAVSSATSESRVVRIRGRKKAMDILTDRMHVRPQNGRGFVQHLPGMKTLLDTDVAATVYDLRGKDRADLIAYLKGRPRTDANKILLTRRVCVRLAQGVTFSRFATHSGAYLAERPFYAPEALILTYPTALEALDAVDRLAATPGVLGANIMIAQQHIPDFIPNVTYFSGGGPPYQPPPKTDNVDGWITPPFLVEMIIPPTVAYQWWANNIGIPAPAPLTPPILTEPSGTLLGGGPTNGNPLRVDLGDFPPISYDVARPLFSGELADLRLPLAWENLGNFDRPVSGNMRRVLIIDDGIQKSHPDLFNAVEANPTLHWNYFNNQQSADPLNNADTHGTSMAGIVGARIKQVGSRVCGVAPNCWFNGVVALKGYVDDFEWADAFAFSAPPSSGPPEQGGGPPEGNNRGTIKDSDHDNEWLDETRSGIVGFEIALNAQSNLGAQDATDLFTEDWLWKRAIRFSATRGYQTRGVAFVTSSGNGAEGHMDLNYSELKNCIYQIPVGGVSEMGRRIAYSSGGAPLVCVAPTWGQELPPYLNWPGPPPPALWPTNRPVQKNAPIGPDDIVSRYRRVTQGITSITNTAFNGGIDFNLNGTSCSAAMVAGVCALMREVNPNLSARDIKEILLRSSRVCGDIRVDRGPTNSPADDDIIRDSFQPVTMGGGAGNGPAQTYLLKTGQMWRMMPMGHAIHPFFGAGLIDADKAVKIAKKWKPLPPNPFPPIEMDVLDEDFGKQIGIRNTETGGRYIGLSIIKEIPKDGTPIELLVQGPPSGMRVEHIEVRLWFYHGRRGDLEITLVAPGGLGWEKGRELESELFVPHRDDYNEDRYSNVAALRDRMDWTFTTVRHWGTVVDANGAGQWKIRVRDTVTQGATYNPSITDPVYTPVTNPDVQQNQRVEGAGITYHGTFSKNTSNIAPEVTAGNLRFEPSPNIRTAQLTVAELGRNQQTGEIVFPVTSWDVWSNTVTRVDGEVVPNYTPVQPTAPPVDYLEFFPPQARDNVDPTIRRPISFLGRPWPRQPFSPMWVSFALNPAIRPATWPPAPTSGPLGALTQRPRWLEMTPDELWMVVRDPKNNNPATNFIHIRLNRATGLLEVIPHNKGKFFLTVYAENLLGLSKPKEIEIGVTNPGYQNWADIYWDEPDLVDPVTLNSPVSGWLADPDGDGYANGLEYALRLTPTTPDTVQIPDWRIEGEPGQEEIVFTWSEDLTASDADLFPMVSEDLESWGKVPPADITPVGTLLNGMQTYEYRLPLSAEPRTYFRLWSDYNKNLGNP